MLSNLLQGTQFESGRVRDLNPGSLASGSLYSTIALNCLYFIAGLGDHLFYHSPTPISEHLVFVLTNILQSVT